MANGDKVIVEFGVESRRMFRHFQNALDHSNELFAIAQGATSPTWDEIVESGTLTRNRVEYTVITQGDEGYIRVEAKEISGV